MSERPTYEWDLLHTHGTERALLFRMGPGNPWQRVATFSSYNDAERVLRILREGR